MKILLGELTHSVKIDITVKLCVNISEVIATHVYVCVCVCGCVVCVD